MTIRKILLVRPDNIGDVVLTLPMAGLIKEHLPQTKVAFLGQTYTESVIKKSAFVDEVYDWKQWSADPVEAFQSCRPEVVVHVYPNKNITVAARQAAVPVRIGTARRWFNLLNCNRLVWLKRRGSYLHEAQLNIRLLSPLGIKKMPDIESLPDYYGWKHDETKQMTDVISGNKYNVVLHPKSQGHGCEWPLKNYCSLASLLPQETFNVLVTGTKEEGMIIRQECPELLALNNVTDVTGRYDLETFVALIEQADCLVASGTGPVHLSAAAGTFTVGLYPPVRPIHPGRWQPIGRNVRVLCKGELTADKKDLYKIGLITPEDVEQAIRSVLT